VGWPVGINLAERKDICRAFVNALMNRHVSWQAWVTSWLGERLLASEQTLWCLDMLSHILEIRYCMYKWWKEKCVIFIRFSWWKWTGWNSRENWKHQARILHGEGARPFCRTNIEYALTLPVLGGPRSLFACIPIVFACRYGDIFQR
jgi:hypothetical protein